MIELERYFNNILDSSSWCIW